jgi:hypothetical protein
MSLSSSTKKVPKYLNLMQKNIKWSSWISISSISVTHDSCPRLGKWIASVFEPSFLLLTPVRIVSPKRRKGETISWEAVTNSPRGWFHVAALAVSQLEYPVDCVKDGKSCVHLVSRSVHRSVTSRKEVGPSSLACSSKEIQDIWDAISDRNLDRTCGRAEVDYSTDSVIRGSGSREASGHYCSRASGQKEE